MPTPNSLDNASPRWHSRGYVPHLDLPEGVQHVTFHLADSLPTDALARIEESLHAVRAERRDAEPRTRVQDWIDAGHGCCILREPAVAEMVQASFLHFDGERYRLLAWVVMPNHVHVLVQPLGEWRLSRIVASWKSWTGRPIVPYLSQAGEQLGGQSGRQRVWYREYWDRLIRNEGHCLAAVAYIHDNPVKAGLVATAEEWPWSSVARAVVGIEGLG